MPSSDLDSYRDKRNTGKSGEPEGSSGSTAREGRRFVIQKHDASTLHYDFRLQIGDVLASWAVPKGLNLTPNDKHLAIRTEDHPLDYADFEGVIPEGEYGAGTVLVWDSGTYTPLPHDDDRDAPDKTMEEALEQGALKFRLDGHKLEGGYAMVRTDGEGDEEGANWLIFKLDDESADARRNPPSTQTRSVKTGRTLDDVAEEEAEEEEIEEEDSAHGGDNG